MFLFSICRWMNDNIEHAEADAKDFRHASMKDNNRFIPLAQPRVSNSCITLHSIDRKRKKHLEEAEVVETRSDILLTSPQTSFAKRRKFN